jgi:hypothetical protein
MLKAREATAFPFAATDPSNLPLQTTGMTLRDWLAGQAMVALSCNAVWELLEPVAQSNFAQSAYELTDAMLAAREATP